MSIIQLNNYAVNKSITNLMLNQNYDFLGDDRIFVTVDWAAQTFTVKAGSIWEYLGNRFILADNDLTITIPDTKIYCQIGFNGSTFVPMKMRADVSYQIAKYGFYTSDNIRIMRWVLDCANQKLIEIPTQASTRNGVAYRTVSGLVYDFGFNIGVSDIMSNASFDKASLSVTIDGDISVRSGTGSGDIVTHVTGDSGTFQWTNGNPDDPVQTGSWSLVVARLYPIVAVAIVLAPPYQSFINAHFDGSVRAVLS